VGIVDVFATANDFLPPERQYQLELLTSSTQSTIEGMCGLQFAGARHYSTLQGEIDTLLVPGVLPGRSIFRRSCWIGSGHASKCRRVGSICTGAYIWLRPDSRRQTSGHPLGVSKEFSSRFPKVTIDGNPIWIRDGNIYSSAA
jgi:transcriptional regulator GlxA family with amidase domain